MATLTASSYAGQPKQVHVGNISAHVYFNGGSTAAGSAGDVILLGKVPNRATVLDLRIRGTSAAAGGTWVFYLTKGKTASQSTTLATIGTLTVGTTAVVARANDAFAPFQVSLSDDDAVQYAVLKAQCLGSTTSSTSLSFDGAIVWAMNAEPVS